MVGGRLFEAGRLLTFSAFRMGAYSRWALANKCGILQNAQLSNDYSLELSESSSTIREKLNWSMVQFCFHADL